MMYKLSDEDTPKYFSASIDSMVQAIEANLSPLPQHKHNRIELERLEAIRALYICDFNQNKTCDEWQQYLQMDTITYNEALCILLGVFPVAAELISDDLSTVSKEAEVHTNTVSYMFFKSSQNNFLRRRFDSTNIQTDEFVSWALSKEFFSSSSNTKPKKKKTIKAVEQQKLINKLAKKLMKETPALTKQSLAMTLAEDVTISISEETIRRNYLNDFPDFS